MPTQTLNKRGDIYTIRYWDDLDVDPIPPLIRDQTIGVTGHRPPKLGGYGHTTRTRLQRLCAVLLSKIKPRMINSGMALGFDQAVCEAACLKGVLYKAFVPCETQSDSWPDESRERWRTLLEQAADVDLTSGPYTHNCMKERDKRIVDNSSIIITLWDGQQEEGGTTHTVHTALREGKHVVNLWKLWERI